MKIDYENIQIFHSNNFPSLSEGKASSDKRFQVDCIREASFERLALWKEIFFEIKNPLINFHLGLVESIRARRPNHKDIN